MAYAFLSRLTGVP
ncbi:uncharacterized protein FFFS_15986 [Fusarium fujikuroi]|nr:uncharacterized protein FFFS_15986 [Fusarium fujikuroi]